ncbi:MAG TPA: CRISPR-associated endonuclease Cas3'' [Tepidisphaeraceae bacterium]
MQTPVDVYAHTKPGHDRSHWEPLTTHLQEVAGQAATFADAFGAREWGHTLGAWHDLGKYSDAFQTYLQTSHDADAGEESASPGRVDHSTYGARHARERLPGITGQLLAACIAGHHGGLPDTLQPTTRGTLGFRMDPSLWPIKPVALSAEVSAAPKLTLPWRPAGSEPVTFGFSLAFFGRMLFSCLIDADRLATERFCDPSQAAERGRPTPTLGALKNQLDTFLKQKQRQAPTTPVNAVRRQVLAECLTAAARPPGFFSLNVPTGGGKTFASLAFALHHAATHPMLHRVVVGIPGSVD